MARQAYEEGEAHARHQLEAKVLELEAKLAQLHATDANALRRAHATLSQHIQALSIESAHFPELLAQLETSLLTSTNVAGEAGVLSAVCATAWAVDRCLRMARLQSPSRLLALCAAVAVGWRLLRSSTERVASVMAKNRRTKAALLHDWRAVDERLTLLLQLSQYTPSGGELPTEAAAGTAIGTAAAAE
ncbi:hypothetical protein FOA52_000377 [Chlamydomonas sp. UWO 241]|nr:hypothetical protein FOA52_000377 [Chlamydomonas sp. UWO 241]